MSTANFEPQGVIPACLLPFHPDLSIDEKSFRKHLRDVAGVRGLSAITVNAHATEVASCTFEEQQRVLEITMDEVGGRIPVVHGVYADGSLEAARIARAAERGGSSCLLVFPPNPLGLGSRSRPEMVIAHFKAIADASDLPLICFQYPLAGGLGYPVETLLEARSTPCRRCARSRTGATTRRSTSARYACSSRAPRPVNVLIDAQLVASLLAGARLQRACCRARAA